MRSTCLHPVRGQWLGQGAEGDWRRMDWQPCGTAKFTDASRQFPVARDGAIINPINEPTEKNSATQASLVGEMIEEAIYRLRTCTESFGLRRNRRRHAGLACRICTDCAGPRIRSRRRYGNDSSHFRGNGARRPCRICAWAFSAYYLLQRPRSWNGYVTHARRSCRVPAISATGFATGWHAEPCQRIPRKADGACGRDSRAESRSPCECIGAGCDSRKRVSARHLSGMGDIGKNAGRTSVRNRNSGGGDRRLHR